MDWKFRNDIPIYSQLIEQIELRIVSGVYAPGERLQSVRDMSMEAGVNPNTMQRALQELERQGMVYSQRTAGRFVTEDSALIAAAKKALAKKHIEDYIQSMAKIGFSGEEMIAVLAESVKEEKANGNT
ncbi:MAG: GntR family transcriptional regulator [Oscillospiraceae bacterium]|nr:GntR family transcriptional regulator [Oscillospiraceae bacterium]